MSIFNSWHLTGGRVRRVIFIVLTMSIASVSFAQQLSVESLVREAQVSNSLSDRIKAFRLMSFLKDKRPESFYKDGVVEYLEALSRVASQKRFIDECTSFSKIKNIKSKDTILFTCGRLLIDSFSLQQAQEFLSQASASSDFGVQSAILSASLSLGDSDGEKCLRKLNPKLVSKIKNPNTRDLYYITRARCFVEMNQMDKSILQYQQISPSSSYYFDALEETAWAQFKIRRLESARTLLDVLITTFETNLGDNKKVSAASYFRSRYLQAYIELIERNNIKAEQQFRGLRDSIKKYISDTQIDEVKIRKFAQVIAEQNIKWIDAKAIPKEILSYLDIIKQWGDNRMRKRIDRLIDYQFTLARELQRLRAEPGAEFEGYLKDLAELEVKNRTAIELELVRAMRGVDRVLRVVKIKAELGSIEITWSQRAQGVRGIGELLETYQSEIDEVEDYFSNL